MICAIEKLQNLTNTKMSRFREEFCKEHNIEIKDLNPCKSIFKYYSYWLESKLEEALSIGNIVGQGEELKPLEGKFAKVLNEMFKNKKESEPTKKRF